MGRILGPREPHLPPADSVSPSGPAELREGGLGGEHLLPFLSLQTLGRWVGTGAQGCHLAPIPVTRHPPHLPSSLAKCIKVKCYHGNLCVQCAVVAEGIVRGSVGGVAHEGQNRAEAVDGGPEIHQERDKCADSHRDKFLGASGAQVVKNLPAMQETRV